eukprot:527773_1
MLHSFQALIKFLMDGGLSRKIKIAIATFFIWFLWANRAKKHKTIPTRSYFIPILGHLHVLLFGEFWNAESRKKERLDSIADNILAAKEPIVSIAAFGLTTMVTPQDPKLIKYIFQDNFTDFVKGEQVHERLNELLGDGIFSSDPPRWSMHRKIGSRMFSMRNLKNYMFEVAKRGDARFMAKIEELRVKQ